VLAHHLHRQDVERVLRRFGVKDAIQLRLLRGLVELRADDAGRQDLLGRQTLSSRY
jgi:hypothetical protein